MAHILCIQSHVVFGHAGNAAAVFPLQCLGHQVSALNLLQYSNHSGYSHRGGQVISTREIESIFDALKKNHMTDKIDCIMTGYIGDHHQVAILQNFIREAKANNPELIYCCDPVLGDEPKGMYVKPEIKDVMIAGLIPLADIITPNRYELGILTETPIQQLSLPTAANKFTTLGKSVLATSAGYSSNKNGIAYISADEADLIETPHYELNPTVRGTGDATAAIFMGHLLSGLPAQEALTYTGNTLHDIVHYTNTYQCQELAIVPCQDSIRKPKQNFQTTCL